MDISDDGGTLEATRAKGELRRETRMGNRRCSIEEL